MATPDISKIVSIPEMYRFVRDEVPLGKALAPITAWMLLAMVLVWSGSVIWKGVGLPALIIARSGASALPSGQLGSSFLAVGLFFLVLLVVGREIRRVRAQQIETLGLIETIVDRGQHINTRMIDLQAESINVLSLLTQHATNDFDLLLERVKALEERQSPPPSTHDQ